MDQTTALQGALAQHQASHLENARADYEAVLKRNPNDLNALHLLGVLENLTGHRDAAVRRCPWLASGRDNFLSLTFLYFWIYKNIRLVQPLMLWRRS